MSKSQQLKCSLVPAVWRGGRPTAAGPQRGHLTHRDTASLSDTVLRARTGAPSPRRLSAERGKCPACPRTLRSTCAPQGPSLTSLMCRTGRLLVRHLAGTWRGFGEACVSQERDGLNKHEFPT